MPTNALSRASNPLSSKDGFFPSSPKSPDQRSATSIYRSRGFSLKTRRKSQRPKNFRKMSKGTCFGPEACASWFACSYTYVALHAFPFHPDHHTTVMSYGVLWAPWDLRYIHQSSGMSYCDLCSRWFTTVEGRDQHIASSQRHPRCGTCDKRFMDDVALDVVRLAPCVSERLLMIFMFHWAVDSTGEHQKITLTARNARGPLCMGKH